jgi:hypothetical protein
MVLAVYNAHEIHHFVQNDTLFYQKDRESRQWILRYALNDREKTAEKLNNQIEEPIIYTQLSLLD